MHLVGETRQRLMYRSERYVLVFDVFARDGWAQCRTSDSARYSAGSSAGRFPSSADSKEQVKDKAQAARG